MVRPEGFEPPASWFVVRRFSYSLLLILVDKTYRNRDLLKNRLFFIPLEIPPDSSLLIPSPYMAPTRLFQGVRSDEAPRFQRQAHRRFSVQPGQTSDPPLGRVRPRPGSARNCRWIKILYLRKLVART